MTCRRALNKFLEVKITKREQRAIETLKLINSYLVKERTFYCSNERVVSNITGDIIFSTKIDLKIRTLNTDKEHFVNDLPKHRSFLVKT